MKGGGRKGDGERRTRDGRGRERGEGGRRRCRKGRGRMEKGSKEKGEESEKDTTTDTPFQLGMSLALSACIRGGLYPGITGMWGKD